MKKIRKPARIVPATSTIEVAESQRASRFRVTSTSRASAVARAAERRISMLTKVEVASTVNRQKAKKKVLSTVNNAAASTMANESSAKYKWSRSRCTEKILKAMMNSTRCTLLTTKLRERRR